MKRSYHIFSVTATCILFSCMLKNSKADCESVKTGNFEMRSEIDNSVSLINRNDSIQTETNTKTGHIVRSRIKWNTNCEYILTYLSQTKNSSDTVASY